MPESSTPRITVTEAGAMSQVDHRTLESVRPLLDASGAPASSNNSSIQPSRSSCSSEGASSADPPSSVRTTQQGTPQAKQRYGGARQPQRTLLTRLAHAFDPTKYTAPLQPRGFNPKTTVREYRRKRQKRRILLDSGTRYLASIILCILCALVLLQYSSIGNEMSANDFRWFNTLMTALPLFIALNFRMSLQSYAKIMRWWILAKWQWPLRQIDLILDLATSKAVLKLMWHARRPRNGYVPTLTQVACAAWLLVNLAGALSIALLSLTYDVGQPGTNVSFRIGNVSTLDLTREALFDNAYNYVMYPSNERPPYRSDIRPNRADYLWEGLETLYEHDGRAAWRYRLRDSWHQLTAPSIRFVIARAECYKKSLEEMNETRFIHDGMSNTGVVLSGFDVETIATNTSWTDTVMFMHSDKPDQLCANQSGCAGIIVVYRGVGFACANSILEEASETTRWPATHMSNSSASTLAAAITTRPDRHNKTTTQGLVLSYDDAWSPRPYYNPDDDNPDDDKPEASRVASILSQFSMTVLAAAEQGTGGLPSTIPDRTALRCIVEDGRQPYLAAILSIDSWMVVFLVILAVPVLQGIMFLVVLFYSDAIIVLEESHVCISRVLAPITRDLEGQGSLLGIEDVIKAVDGRGDGVPLRYAYEETNRHWEREKKWQKFRAGFFYRPTGRLVKAQHGKFPEGKYD